MLISQRKPLKPLTCIQLSALVGGPGLLRTRMDSSDRLTCETRLDTGLVAAGIRSVANRCLYSFDRLGDIVVFPDDDKSPPLNF